MSFRAKKIEYLNEKAKKIRELTVECIGKLGFGHIGGASSICETLAALYFDIMHVDPENPDMEDRDRLVLSKGHAGPALYSALALKGYFPIAELDTLNRPNTHLPSHCDRKLTKGIDMTTGSLGQGFSAAVGMALAAQLDKKDLFVYAIIGDGESQEGQIWEAAMMAGTRKLDHLIAFTDYNKMQIDGYTGDVNTLDPLDKRWESFGWNVHVVDGHDIGQILSAVDTAKKQKGRPTMIILNTIKGKGLYFAENKLDSHNMNISEEMWKKAVAQLEEEEM